MRPSRWLLVTLSLLVFACGGGSNNDGNTAACSDGIDNDDDGKIDFPDDPGCSDAADDTEETPAMPQCSDGRDNDGDGKTDYPNDPACFAPQGDDEVDDCPDGPFCPLCSNGIDDDNNGLTDFPEDTGCESAGDSNEFLNNPTACGAGLTIKQISESGMDSGTFASSTSTSTVVSPCGGGAGAPAIAYVMLLTEPKVIVASTDFPGTSADTVIDIRGAQCTQANAHIACNDDISTTNSKSSVTKSLPPGIYYIIVQGHDVSEMGTYELKIDRFAGEGIACAAQSECGPGLICRTPAGASAMVCSQPVCGDGLDDDADGKIDYPADPGCESLTDAAENDTCPGVGPGCPECADGADNDSDGLIDFPADTSCLAPSGRSEACLQSEPITQLTQPFTAGTTTGAVNDFRPPPGSYLGSTCSSSSTHSAPDVAYELTLPAMATLNLNLNIPTFWDSSHSLLNASCNTTAPIACRDSTSMPLTNVAAGRYYLVVDGYSTGSGAYNVIVSGTIANGGSCEAPLAQSGALLCSSGYACKGTAGSRTCQIAQCADGLDNNSDGKTDYPNDAGCSSSSDDTETTVCPGAQCPVCSNTVDDDADAQIDYPTDVSCTSAGHNSEACRSTEQVITLTQPATAGDTTNAIHDVRNSCSSSTSTSKDLTYRLDLPATTTLTLSLTNKSMDSTMALMNATCGGVPIVCSDPDTTTQSNLAAGTYYLVVEGYSTTGASPFSLNVVGKIANGASCESPLALSGALTCNTGYTCQGTAGSRTCAM
ncbi:MAG: hypothetical protein H0T89_32600 [Deltaproteobacteria bacterium]|nr:hypothetical protein [Deltaproteobacteria bacterium]